MIKKIMYHCLSLLFKMIPKNKHLWVTGKTSPWLDSNIPPAFFDNSKYFYLYLVNNTKEKVFWLTSSENEYSMLKTMELPVVQFPSIKGIYLVLRAKFSFHHYGTDQINYTLQRGSVQLDFWHGTPLKKIRYDVVGQPVEKHGLYRDFMKKGGEEYVFSTSKYLSEKVLTHAFAVDIEHILNFGYPRTDVMGLMSKNNIEFCERYSKDLLPYIRLADHFEKVFLYMPTFRDDDPEYFEKASIDFETMSNELRKIDAILFIKLHPLTKNTKMKKYDNIVQISNDVDIYPFLQCTDFLITDYSSIFFDYLILDKEIIFIPYDYDNYVRHRELYYDYDEITPGKKYYSFSEFICDLHQVGRLDYSADRKRIRDLMIEDYHFDACKRTYEFIKERYSK